MSKHLLSLIAVLMLLATFGVTQAQTPAVSDGTSNTTIFVQPQPPVNGIIMRDGGICDPIRHMGC